MEDIRSIERMPRGQYWFVDLYTTAGAIVPVARLAKMSEAHMVVTQLNTALEDLRRDLAILQKAAEARDLIN